MILICGLVFQSGGFRKGTVGYNILTAIVTTVIVSAVVSFAVLMGIEVYKSFRDAALHEAQRRAEADRVEMALRGESRRRRVDSDETTRVNLRASAAMTGESGTRQSRAAKAVASGAGRVKVRGSSLDGTAADAAATATPASAAVAGPSRRRGTGSADMGREGDTTTRAGDAQTTSMSRRATDEWTSGASVAQLGGGDAGHVSGDVSEQLAGGDVGSDAGVAFGGDGEVIVAQGGEVVVAAAGGQWVWDAGTGQWRWEPDVNDGGDDTAVGRLGGGDAAAGQSADPAVSDYWTWDAAAGQWRASASAVTTVGGGDDGGAVAVGAEASAAGQWVWDADAGQWRWDGATASGLWGGGDAGTANTSPLGAGDTGVSSGGVDDVHGVVASPLHHSDAAARAAASHADRRAVAAPRVTVAARSFRGSITVPAPAPPSPTSNRAADLRYYSRVK
jgi:hypothetical protein